MYVRYIHSANTFTIRPDRSVSAKGCCDYPCKTTRACINFLNTGTYHHAMSSDSQPASNDNEVYRPAWEGSPAYISHGLPFPEACTKHVANTFQACRVYIIASGSLSRNTDHVQRLQRALGDKVVGTRYGMQPHTLWSEILQIAQDAGEKKADLLVTLGAGSLTDGAKIIATVS